MWTCPLSQIVSFTWVGYIPAKWAHLWPHDSEYKYCWQCTYTDILEKHAFAAIQELNFRAEKEQFLWKAKDLELTHFHSLSTFIHKSIVVVPTFFENYCHDLLFI